MCQKEDEEQDRNETKEMEQKEDIIAQYNFISLTKVYNVQER